jgi:DNA-binding response OmpR family regulator
MAQILLIEPDRILARSYGDALQSVGHVVRLRATAQAAIHAADELTPDVVVLELQLVAHSGVEFLYEFRSYVDWQTVPVIILSSVPAVEFNKSTIVLKQQLGIHSYHYKPQTSITSLQRIIGSIVSPVV